MAVSTLALVTIERINRIPDFEPSKPKLSDKKGTTSTIKHHNRKKINQNYKTLYHEDIASMDMKLKSLCEDFNKRRLLNRNASKINVNNYSAHRLK